VGSRTIVGAQHAAPLLGKIVPTKARLLSFFDEAKILLRKAD
jgi:hypothetical protein